MNLLAMDTSTATLSVAVSGKDGRFFEINQQGALNHGEKLLPLVELVMRQGEMAFDQLDGLVCTVGPGSFTGIRIGISAANAIAMAWHLPVWGISTLEAMAWNARYFEGVILATVDAQRQQFYRGVYSARNGWRCLGEEAVVPKEALLQEMAHQEKVLVVGDLADPCRGQEGAISDRSKGNLLWQEGVSEKNPLGHSGYFWGDAHGNRIQASCLCQIVREKCKTQDWPKGYAQAVYHRLSQAEVQLALKMEKQKGEAL